jgi:hypothetical protein
VNTEKKDHQIQTRHKKLALVKFLKKVQKQIFLAQKMNIEKNDHLIQIQHEKLLLVKFFEKYY